MNKKDKEEVRELTIDALNEVVIPALDNLQGQIKEDIDRLERRLMARENQGDRLANKIENHEKRLLKLERKPKLVN